MGKSFITKIAYTGEAVDDGVMDIKTLAPALLSLADTIEEANKVLNGHESKIQVSVRAGFRQGSFEVEVEVLHTIQQNVQIFLGQMQNLTAEQICMILGAGGGASAFIGVTMLDVIKWLKGRTVKSVKQLQNGNVSLNTGDDEQEISKEVYLLLQSDRVRLSFNGVLDPLKHEGVDCFEFRSEETIRIEKRERIYFELPEIKDNYVEEELPPAERIGVFRIIGVNFEEGLKWRLSDGEVKFYASVLDKNFFEDVYSGNASFSKGDTIKARIRITQKMAGAGLKVEYEVLEVIKFYHRGKQGLLPFPEE